VICAAFVIAAPLVLVSPAKLQARTESMKLSRKGFFAATLRSPVFPKSPSLTKSLQKEAYGALSAWLKESLPGMAEKPRLEYSYDCFPTVALETPRLVSFYYTISTFTAGAHPLTVTDPRTYILESGKPRRLKLGDLCRKGSDYRAAVNSFVMGELLKNSRAEWVQNGQVKELTKEQMEDFVVTPTALTWLFDAYAMGPYAVGAFQVKAPFAELSDVLDRNGPLKPLLSTPKQ
jgi:hypothetical protein